METSRRNFRMNRIGRRALAPLLAVLLLFGVASAADGAPDDQPNGRLGYRWTPDPPKQTFAMPDPVVFQVLKYAGGAVVAIWILRKLFGGD